MNRRQLRTVIIFMTHIRWEILAEVDTPLRSDAGTQDSFAYYLVQNIGEI